MLNCVNKKSNNYEMVRNIVGNNILSINHIPFNELENNIQLQKSITKDNSLKIKTCNICLNTGRSVKIKTFLKDKRISCNKCHNSIDKNDNKLSQNMLIKINNKLDDLNDLEKKLTLKKTELDNAHLELSKLKWNLENKKENLIEKENYLTEKENYLIKKENYLNKKESEIINTAKTINEKSIILNSPNVINVPCSMNNQNIISALNIVCNHADSSILKNMKKNNRNNNIIKQYIDHLYFETSLILWICDIKYFESDIDVLINKFKEIFYCTCFLDEIEDLDDQNLYNLGYELDNICKHILTKYESLFVTLKYESLNPIDIIYMYEGPRTLSIRGFYLL